MSEHLPLHTGGPTPRSVEREFDERPEDSSVRRYDEYEKHIDDALELVNGRDIKELSQVEMIHDGHIRWMENCIRREIIGEKLDFKDETAIADALDSLRDGLRPINCSDDALYSLFRTYRDAHEAVKYQKDNEKNTVFGELSYFPRGILTRLYAYEQDRADQPLRSILGSIDPAHPYMRMLGMRIANKCYDGRLLIDTVAKSDQAVQHLVEAYEHPAYAALDLLPAYQTEGENKAMFAQSQDEAIVDIGNFLQLPTSMYRRYVTAAKTRLRAEGSGLVDPEELRKELHGFIDNALYIGPEWTSRLHEELYVDNLWMYTKPELDIMRDVLERDPATIQYLQNGDVTVVIVDSAGDHNGAFMDRARLKNMYAKKSQRTLTFEIPSNLLGLYRLGAKLNTCGIAPSRVVFGVHGQVGKAYVGGPGEGTILHTDVKKRGYIKARRAGDAQQINLHDTQVGRFLQRLTQAHRGIDSEEGSVGETDIILVTCHGASRPRNEYGRDEMSVADAIASQLTPGMAVFASPKATNIEKEIDPKTGDSFTILYDGDKQTETGRGRHTTSATVKITPAVHGAIRRRSGRSTYRPVHRRPVDRIPGDNKRVTL